MQLFLSSLPAGSLFQYWLLLAWLGLSAFLLISGITYLVRTPVGTWRHAWKWPAVAAVLVALAALHVSRLPVTVRFELGRGQFEAAAARTWPAHDDAWRLNVVGMYPVEAIWSDSGATHFAVWSFGGCCSPFVDYGGFTRSESGPPEDDCDGERKDYEQLDGPWYRFVCYW